MSEIQGPPHSLITFDLANLAATPLPFVVHDSLLLKNIEKPVLARIVQAYAQQASRGKQVFVAYDTLNAYTPQMQETLRANAVLELSSGGNELFGWAWNKKKDDDADESDGVE